MVPIAASTERSPKAAREQGGPSEAANVTNVSASEALTCGDATPSGRWRRLLCFAVKAVISAMAVWWLFKSGRLKLSGDLSSSVHRWRLLLLPVIGVGLALWIQAVRWQRVIRSQGLGSLSMGSTFRLTLIGTFFSCLLPGSAGGDVIKAGYLASASKRYLASFGTIVIDRAVGMLGIVCVAVLGICLRLVLAADLVSVNALAVKLLRFLGLLAIAIVAFIRYFPFLVDKLAHFRRPDPSASDDDAGYVRIDRRTALILVGLSVASQLLMIISTYCVWLAMSNSPVRFLTCLAYVPLSHLANALPISLGGLGVGESVLEGFFAIDGSRLGAEVFLVFRAVGLTWAVAGAALYVGFRGKDLNVSRKRTIEREGAVLPEPAPAAEGPLLPDRMNITR